MTAGRQRAYAAWCALEARLDGAFGAANPLRHLGALAFWLFWIVAVTGIWLYVFLDTSVAGAWRSVEAISAQPLWFGRLVRGLHRYGSDAMLAATLAHLAREWLAGHAAGFRWFSWASGVPLLVLLYASGIGGFWLVWDEQALYSVVATAEWLDWTNLMPEPFARNFTSRAQLVDRLFTLFIFLHIGIPLALLAGMWVHVQRVARPETHPPRALAIGSLAALAVLSVVMPVQSAPPADLGRVARSLALDWFWMSPHPLMYATSPAALWAFALAALAILLAMPLLMRARKLPPAVVSPSDCNGCGRCFVDCPYSAVELVPHAMKAAAPRMARVDPALCAGCGICAGACPSSTPFRSLARFASGIDVPGREVVALRAELDAALARAPGALVVYGCESGVDVAPLAGDGVVALKLLCAGMLPPSFVEFAVRRGAAGVLVAGCAGGACDFRLGMQWTEERLAGAREPHLRANVPRDRVRISRAATPGALKAELEGFRADLVDTYQRGRGVARV